MPSFEIFVPIMLVVFIVIFVVYYINFLKLKSKKEKTPEEEKELATLNFKYGCYLGLCSLLLLWTGLVCMIFDDLNGFLD